MRTVALALLVAATLPAALTAQQAVAGDELLHAARHGELEAVRELIGRGAHVEAKRGDGMTALHLAAERGHAGVARALIDAGAPVDAGTRIGRYTPLHLAARDGHGAVVAHLLEAGADPNAVTTNSGVTPLHLAGGAGAGAPGAVTALLEHGADPNAREGSAGQTPLMFAAAANRTAAVQALLEAGADPGIATAVVDVLPDLALDREANRRFRDILGAPPEMLGLYGPEIDPEAEQQGEPAPAHVQAAILAQRDFLRSGYDVGEVTPHSLGRTGADYPGGPRFVRPPYREVLVGRTGGMTALLHAAREGHIDAATALLDGGADIDQVSADATSPLLMAALNGQFDLALMLIERGADPDLAASTDGATPLFAVLQTQWAPKSNYPQPRAQDVQQTGHMDVLGALLEAGADPNPRLNTHLWYWEYGLTKMGIDLTGATPFWRAAFAQDLDAMKLLVAHGADPHIPTRWPEVGMRERRQQDGRQQEDSALPWIPEGAANAWPIHAAAGGGYLGLGAFSVRNRPDQFIPAVRYLIEELGADVNQRDSWLYTPMHYAASRGDNELIEYLVSQGGEVTAITRLGQSTADMARGGRAGFFTRVPYPATVELLTALGSTLECLHTHFLDTGDSCPGAGVNDPWAPAAATMGGMDGAVVKGGDDRTGPYDPVAGWWKAAPNHDDEWGWGQVAGVAVDHADRIIVVTRGDWPADRSVPREGRLRRTNFVVVANGDGEIVEQWAQWDSIFTLPHQVYINPYDPDRHVWVIDSGGGQGHMQVVKFTNDGSEIVMRLGERDHPKTRAAARARFDWGPHTYGWPSKLAFLPDGSFLLADGYWNSRIIKYSEDGEFIMQWGGLGTGPGEFDLLHGLAVDEDRVYVADRQNERLQLFTHDGDFIEEWPNIFDPVNIWPDENGAVWVLDASLNRVLKYDRDGVLQDYWGAYGAAGAIGRGTWPGGLSLPHQMDMDENGAVYIASYSGGWINKFTPKPNADPDRLMGARLLLTR